MMAEKQKILVIDDDVQLVDTVTALLESVGYVVASAYQAEKGMQLAREIKPDLILLDVMFAGPPGPDGIEISRRLSDDPVVRDVPVIILTGVRKVLDFPFPVEPDETWMPVRAFLEKPIKPKKLLDEIESIIGPRE
ncbi:MAG: response regulator [Anaerolineales bacterium]|nr:response regulator [Anaerolineales bacterium]